MRHPAPARPAPSRSYEEWQAHLASDPFAGWNALRAGQDVPIDPNTPFTGAYRAAEFKGGPRVAVYYWYEDGALLCLVNKKLVDEARALTLWPYAARNAIPYEWYVAVTERGEDWPDIDPTVAEQQRNGIGGNNPPEDEALILAEQIEAAKAGAAEYAKIDNDATLAKAQSLRARLNELSRMADKRREEQKKPHLEAGKAVDAKWQPLVKMAKEAADAIARAMSAFETEKLRKEREAQCKAEEEARRAAEAGTPAPSAPPPPPAPAPVKGAYGRAASVKLVKVAVVTDQDALYRYMRERPEVVELLAKLAQRAVDAGHDVPGVTVDEKRKVA